MVLFVLVLGNLNEEWRQIPEKKEGINTQIIMQLESLLKEVSVLLLVMSLNHCLYYVVMKYWKLQNKEFWCIRV